MPKLYTTRPGAERQIDRYGLATHDVPALVPEEVAAEFDGREGFRVERDEPPRPRLGRKVAATEVKED